MVSLNFKPQFADLVASGRKRQTIRANRKRPIKVGDPLHLYSGMRTAKCKKLVEENPICSEVIVVEILDFSKPISLRSHGEWKILPANEAEQLARDDGFDSLESMLKFFEETHGLPFRGHLIKW